MSTIQFGSKRSFYADGNAPSVPSVHVNRGKFRKLSDADETLVDAIVNCKSYSEEIPMADLEMIEEKYDMKSVAGNMYRQAAGWQPETLGGQIIDIVRAKSKVRNYHQMFNAPTDPYELPVNLENFTASIVGEGVTNGSQKVNQSQVKFTHKKIMIETVVSSEFEEDSVPQTMAFLKDLIATNLMEAEEDLLFFNHATDGMVNKAVDKTPGTADLFNSGSAVTEILNLLSQMDIPYNLDPANIVMYLHPTLYWPLVQSNQVATVDAYGPKATVITGELGKFYGMSVAPIVSLPTISGSPNKYPLILVNRSAVLLSQRRSINIRVFPLEGDKNKLEATIRTAIAYPYGSPAKGIVKENFRTQ